MSTRTGGPLTGLGAAAWWRLVAGIVDDSGPPPTGPAFEADTDEIVGEGLGRSARTP